MAIDLVQDDTGTRLIVSVFDKDTKQAIDGTGASVKVRWTINDGAAVERPMEIVTENPLKAAYQFGAGELAVPIGETSALRLNVVVTDAGGKVLTQLKPITYTIRKEI